MFELNFQSELDFNLVNETLVKRYMMIIDRLTQISNYEESNDSISIPKHKWVNHNTTKWRLNKMSYYDFVDEVYNFCENININFDDIGSEYKKYRFIVLKVNIDGNDCLMVVSRTVLPVKISTINLWQLYCNEYGLLYLNLFGENKRNSNIEDVLSYIKNKINDDIQRYITMVESDKHGYEVITDDGFIYYCDDTINESDYNSLKDEFITSYHKSIELLENEIDTHQLSAFISNELVVVERNDGTFDKLNLFDIYIESQILSVSSEDIVDMASLVI